MASLTFEFEFEDRAAVDYDSGYVRYWATGCGLPDFTGDIDTFADVYPERIATLIKYKLLIKK